MQHFPRIINAAAIILIFVGLVAYFSGLGKRNNVYTFNATQRAANAEPVRPAKAPSMTPREDLELEGGQTIKALDAQTFDTMIADSQNHPVFFMIYASWCPHCKRMFKELNQLQQEVGDDIRVVTVSIDNKPELARDFVGSASPLYLDTYIVKDGPSYLHLGDTFRSHGLNFKGGLSRSVGVPYNTVYYKGKPVAEIGGALPNENLRMVFNDIRKNAK